MATAYTAPRGLSCSSSMANRALSFPPLIHRKIHLPKASLSLPRGPARRPAVSSTVGKLRRVGLVTVVCAMQGKYSAIAGSSWKDSVLQSDIPVLVTFWAPWCGPCRMVHQVIDEVSEEYAGRVHFYRLNTDENPKLTSEYGVVSIPTVLLFKNGEKQRLITGTMPKSVYVTVIENSL
ncbi:hypothetical protein QJS10_CPB13g00637 [Acorus calamus]|uniref:Thioredoxin domain-containing protein n=1 Tax=Acorus calamus TaxID=4465 RepID=A0AAV9DGH9_ACOCL|nr:hypothetical protein QJS10_CPB13g00637 [Acorus calamus]